MRFSTSPPVTALLFVVLAGCAGHATDPTLVGPLAPAGDPAPAGEDEVATLEDFTAGEWSLHVNRSLNLNKPIPANLPSDTLSESDYAPGNEPGVFPVVVSSGGSAISIGAKPDIATEPMLGSREEGADNTRLTFDLNKGTFAGGRFLVWQGPTSLEAELTLYGSGVPIVRSWRGELVRDASTSSDRPR